MTMTDPHPPKPKRRWYHLTPDRLILGLLAVQVFLFLSERFRWFAFNEKKGWTVLIAIGVGGLAVLVLLLWFGTCLVVRRRFPYSLRTLLLLVLVLSVPLGWFAIEMRRARRQKEAVEAILMAGGEVIHDSGWLGRWPADEFYSDVIAVNLIGAEVTDAELQQLKVLTSLRGLFLSDTQVTDAGLKHLKELTYLDGLSLHDRQVGDAGLKHLKGLTNLKALSLHNTQVTDAGLVHLRVMTNLEKLILNNTQVSDAGLKHFKGLTNLKELWLGDTNVTDAGVKKLQKALPKCHILQQPLAWPLAVAPLDAATVKKQQQARWESSEMTHPCSAKQTHYLERRKGCMPVYDN